MSATAELGEKLRQTAEAEAEEAEAEEEEPEPEPEPEEPEQLATIGEDAIKKAERARDGQRKRLAGILGDAYVAHECLFCSGLGYTPEPPPLGARLLIVQGDDGLTFEAEPPPPPRRLKQAPDKARCPECDGEGMCETGAVAEHGAVATCGKCSGNGWIMVSRPEPGAPSVATGGPTLAVPTPGMIAAGTPDAWGRPAGHQHWGVPPAQIPG